MRKGNRSFSVVMVTVLFSAVVACTVGAQAKAGREAGNEQKAGQRKEMMEAKKKEAKEMMETMRVWEMTKALDLTEEQCFKLFPRMKETDEFKEQIQKQRVEAMKELQKLLEAEKPNEGQVKNQLKALEEIEAKVRAKDDEYREEMKEILSPVQQARMYIFLKNFNKKIKGMMMKCKQGEGKGNKAGKMQMKMPGEGADYPPQQGPFVPEGQL